MRRLSAVLFMVPLALAASCGGGGASTTTPPPSNNPAPTVASTSPTSATAGGAAFTLTVTGANFISSSTVQWNGTGLTTTYGSSTSLTASVPASSIATAGTASVTVVNPAPGGGTSASQTFTINAAGNPAPTLTSISPSSASAGGASFTLTATGTNFNSGSTVEWNGANLTTTYVSSTSLTASVPANGIATAGTASVTVVNPAPGGGTSSVQTFTIGTAGSACTAGSQQGAIVYSGGVSFRVWAPHATSVAVEGDFNGWTSTKNPLASQSGGYWCADVAGATAGQQFQYALSTPDGAITRRDPYSREVTSNQDSAYSIVYDPAEYSWTNTTFQPPDKNKLLIYELAISTFNSPGFGAGTFQTAIAKLPMISALGFNAIEVLPVNEWAGNPYGPTDVYAIEHEYGGADNFKALVDAAHQSSLAVIVDIENNHWGPFGAATYRFDGYYDNTYPMGIYFYNSTTWNGTSCTPGTDPYCNIDGPRANYGDSHVAAYIQGQVEMFFNEYHIDGLRWDSVSNIYNTCDGGQQDSTCQAKGVSLPGGVQVLQAANTWVGNQYPKAIKIAEDLSFSSNALLDTQPAGSNGGLGFDAEWNGGFLSSVRSAIIANPIPLSGVVSGMKDVYNNDPFQGVIYYESHNEVSYSANSRLISQVDSANPTSRLAQKKSALATSILLTTPGIPMIFQGDEMMDTSWNDNKTPMSWSSDVANYSGMRQLHADLAALRTNQASRSAGLTDSGLNLYQQDSANNVLVYDRYSISQPGKDDVVVVSNLSGTVFSGSNLYTICLPSAGTWNVLFNSDSTKYSSLFGGVGPSATVTAVSTNACFSYGETYGATIPLGDYSTLVLSQH